MTDAYVSNERDSIKILANLKCDASVCDGAGAPKAVQVVYTLSNTGLSFDVLWFEKDANRTTEAIFLHIYPSCKELSLVKIGSKIDYQSVVPMGGRNLHAVEKCVVDNESCTFEIINRHSPLVSVGQGKILEYDNMLESVQSDGLSYVLYDNVWGTNFPLWYEENARFSFEIQKPLKK